MEVVREVNYDVVMLGRQSTVLLSTTERRVRAAGRPSDEIRAPRETGTLQTQVRAGISCVPLQEQKRSRARSLPLVLREEVFDKEFSGPRTCCVTLAQTARSPFLGERERRQGLRFVCVCRSVRVLSPRGQLRSGPHFYPFFSKIFASGGSSKSDQVTSSSDTNCSAQ